MRKTGLILTVVLAVLLTAASTTAIVVYRRTRLADPATADREGLLRWLVTRDLAQESPQIRQTLARRLDHEFGGDESFDWQAVAKRLDETQIVTLSKNVPLVIEPWFVDRADEFARLPKAERTAFLDRVIEKVRLWATAGTLKPASQAKSSSKSSLSGASLLPMLMERLEAWKQQAEPDQRQRMMEFVGAIQFRWLQRSLFGSKIAIP